VYVKMAINMTLVPESVANILGVDVTMAGILISVLLTMCVLLALAYLNASTMLVAIGAMGMIFLFTILTWFPVWLTIIVSLIGAGILAGSLSGRSKGVGEGG